MNSVITDLDLVREIVRSDAAIVIDPSKGYLVDSRLMPLAGELSLPSVAAVIALVRDGDRSVRARVVDAMTTNETSWFRDEHIFRTIEREVIPALLEHRGRERRLHVWSAACSSGQEAYTLAMLIAEQLADRPDGAQWNWSVLGTDLSASMLDRARSGRYDQLDMNRGLPGHRLSRHFGRSGDGWQINAEIRGRVQYAQLNLAGSFPPMPQADLILLRNVLIYFDAPTRRSVLERVVQRLRPGGYLVLGAAESLLGVPNSLQPVRIGPLSCYQHGKASA
jgi:chemotaxis protein methyltransferase CheR